MKHYQGGRDMWCILQCILNISMLLLHKIQRSSTFYILNLDSQIVLCVTKQQEMLVWYTQNT